MHSVSQIVSVLRDSVDPNNIINKIIGHNVLLRVMCHTISKKLGPEVKPCIHDPKFFAHEKNRIYNRVTLVFAYM